MQEMIEQSKATGSALTVALAVAFYANPESGLAWPSDQTLMDEWGLSEATIRRGLRAGERLGHLVREPALESFERRRVYRVGSGQLSLLEGDRQTPVSALTPVSLACAGSDGVEPKGEPKTPPDPPLKGGELSSRSSLLLSTAAAHGVGGARRRRRARRAAMRSGFASEPCPLQDDGALEAQDLARLWAGLAAGLREHLGLEQWEVWFTGAHPHRLDGEVLVLGMDPVHAAWVRERFGRAIALACERPLALVGCERQAGVAR